MRRILLVGGTLAYLCTVVWIYAMPRHPDAWYQLGHSRLYDPALLNPREAKVALLKAASGNPMEPVVWIDVADAFFQLGDAAESEEALETAQRVYPQSPAIAWRLANALILANRPEESLPFLKTIARSDPDQREAVFDLAWKILDSGARVQSSVLPSELDAKSQYLAYMIKTRPESAPVSVWRDLAAGRDPSAATLGYQLIDTLLSHSRAKEADKLWTEILAYTQRSSARPAGTLLTNGGFEFDPAGAGLDWRLPKNPQWRAELDPFTFHGGSRSLLFSFNGTPDTAFDGLGQLVVVEPNRNYELSAFIKTENLLVDRGIRIVVKPYPDSPLGLPANGPLHSGTQSWAQDTIQYHTGRSNTVIYVGLYVDIRNHSEVQSSGKLWVDDLLLLPK